MAVGVYANFLQSGEIACRNDVLLDAGELRVASLNWPIRSRLAAAATRFAAQAQDWPNAEAIYVPLLGIHSGSQRLALVGCSAELRGQRLEFGAQALIFRLKAAILIIQLVHLC